MTLRQVDVNGNPYVGVVCEAADDLVLVPNEAKAEHVKLISETLDVPAVPMTVGGTNLLGTMITMNSRGAVVGDIIGDDELERLSEHRDVVVLHGRLNCAGNLILANDSKAWVHPRLGDEVRADIADVLDVEVGEGDLAGMGVVGSVGTATNKGVLVHPKARKDELEALREFFGVQVDIGTLNYGSPMIGACCVANSRGAVTGTASTGIELGRLEEALDLID
ncbi:MAG: translation initiation factor IF-6 [Thermoplasmata archaeon]|nr:MAG: translation initiation factor IF-6 [Thermoplasmata archaeon]